MKAINDYINIEKTNINNFAKEILSTYYDEELFNKILNVYINCRYYNYESFAPTTFNDDILHALKKELEKLLIGTEPEVKQKLKEMYLIYYYIFMFDGLIQAPDKKLVTLLSQYRDKLFDEQDMLFKENIEKIIRTTNEKRKQFINMFKSEDFEIKRKGTSDDKVFDIVLNHKIEFPKLYSEFAIDRVFTTGNVNEDKLLVLYYIVSGVIIKDIKKCIYDNYYLIEFAPSLFENKEKLSATLEVIDNDIFRDHIYFKMSFEDYSKYSGNVKDMIKLGYKFVLICTDEDLKDDNFVLSSMFDYIVVDKNSIYLSDSNKNIIYIK